MRWSERTAMVQRMNCIGAIITRSKSGFWGLVAMTVIWPLSRACAHSSALNPFGIGGRSFTIRFPAPMNVTLLGVIIRYIPT